MESLQKFKLEYEKYATIPTISSGKLFLNPKDQQLFSFLTFKQTHFPALTKTTFLNNYHIDLAQKTSIKIPFPIEIDNETLFAFSENGNFYATIKSTDENNTTLISVWDQHRKLFTQSIKDMHKKIYNESFFSCFSFSPDNSKLLYVAEFFDKENQKNPNFGNKSFWDNDCIRNQQDWGEAFSGLSTPMLFVFDIKQKTSQIVSGIPENISPGSGIWKDDNTIIFNGYEKPDVLMGIEYCYNRKSAIYQISLDKESPNLERLTTFFTVRSPRLNSTKTQLAFLAADEFKVHNNPVKLCVLDLQTNKIRVLVDVPKSKNVKDDYVLFEEKKIYFPGLFLHQLIENCWIENDTKIILNTQWKSTGKILSVDVTQENAQNQQFANVSFITDPSDDGVWSLLDSNHNSIIAKYSTPCLPYQVYYGNPIDFISSNMIQKNCVCLENSLDVINIDNDFEWSLHQIHVDDIESEYEMIVLQKKRSTKESEEKKYALVSPHGGPVSIYSTSFIFTNLFLCSLGYQILIVNYRGSLGFHPKILNSLTGKVGTQDINDVQNAVKFSRENQIISEKTQIGVIGGSHGGFITTHLIGQFPDFYKVAAVRNPVINIAIMSTTSDIPDWCTAETDIPKQPFTLNSDDLREMWNASPIRYVDNVKTPILMLIGNVDRRVPKSQGIEFYKSLKLRGKTTEIVIYEKDRHPLSRPETQADMFIRMALWLEKITKELQKNYKRITKELQKNHKIITKELQNNYKIIIKELQKNYKRIIKKNYKRITKGL
ncbi:acylamino-acid-releasing enzyme [Anaeramoeba ignava]|uniref:acylaminoacyl-peptidase n=1 Tax=Anaeramoeba ignava TaxID=1746090 RepID=A0A9Q0LSG5_ANAIG|nr:acylamino-acid-releasing enzyme [Anaeramoeba ignava]